MGIRYYMNTSRLEFFIHAAETFVAMLRSTIDWTDVRKTHRTKTKARESRVYMCVCARPRSFAVHRHLKLVRPSLRLILPLEVPREPRHSQLSGRDVSRPASCERVVRVRACVSRCFKPDPFRCSKERAKKFSLGGKRNDPNEFG